MTSKSTLPRRFTKIDDLTRPDHHYLTVDDTCYFISEYTARQGHTYSPTNSLILNFKKTVDRRERPEWQYKEKAIQKVASAFRTALKQKGIDRLTFVPVPPSKAKEDPLYDDRLIRMLQAIRPDPALDIRELVVQTGSTDAVHRSGERPAPNQIEELYRVDDVLTEPPPEVIAVVDDILTTGAHFRAMKSALSTCFPAQMPVIGLFIARRAPDTADFW